jgi:transposase-like protein
MEKRMQRSYTVETRREAVRLAREQGASKTAQELGIPLDTLYTWMSREKNGRLPEPVIMAPEARKALTQTERIKELEQENKRLRTEIVQIKREHQILEDAAVFFAGRRKK